MVGISRGDIGAIGLWFSGLSRQVRIAIVSGLALLVVLLAWTILHFQQNARLIRTAPDALAANAAMMHYAVDRGRGLFESRCASCHGREGEGRRGLGSANLTDNDYLYGQGDISDIETVVLYGIRAPDSRTWKLADMPAFAQAQPYAREKAIKPLSPGDIRDVIQFLRSGQGQRADVQAATRGAAIYAGRGGCYDCHAGDAKGDPAIGAPDLLDAVWLYGDGSDKEIFRSIADGRAGQCPAWSGRLSPVNIREVSAYVYSLSHGGAKAKPSLP